MRLFVFFCLFFLKKEVLALMWMYKVEWCWLKKVRSMKTQARSHTHSSLPISSFNICSVSQPLLGVSPCTSIKSRQITHLCLILTSTETRLQATDWRQPRRPGRFLTSLWIANLLSFSNICQSVITIQFNWCVCVWGGGIERFVCFFFSFLFYQQTVWCLFIPRKTCTKAAHTIK